MPVVLTGQYYVSSVFVIRYKYSNIKSNKKEKLLVYLAAIMSAIASNP